MRFWVFAIGASAIGASASAGCTFDGDPVSPGDAGNDAADAALDAAPLVTQCQGSAATVVACYDFENDVTDGSLNGHEAQTVGNPQFVDAQVGRGLRFDGDDSAFVPDSDDFDVSALTMEVWFVADQLPPDNTERLFWDTQSQYAIMLFDDDGRVRCGAAGGPQGTFGVGEIEVGVPHYLACTITASELRVYVDGREVGNLDRGNSPLVTGPTAGSAIAADINNSQVPSNQFVGVIDTLRISSVAKSESEICDAAGIAADQCGE